MCGGCPGYSEALGVGGMGVVQEAQLAGSLPSLLSVASVLSSHVF
jgi:hypothetical protein